MTKPSDAVVTSAWCTRKPAHAAIFRSPAIGSGHFFSMTRLGDHYKV